MAPAKTKISDSLSFCFNARSVSLTIFLLDSLFLCSETRSFATVALFMCLTAAQGINIRAYTEFISTEKYGFWAMFHLRAIPTYAVGHAIVNMYTNYFACGFKKFELFQLLDLSPTSETNTFPYGFVFVLVNIVGILIVSSFVGNIKDAGRNVSDVWMSTLQNALILLSLVVEFDFMIFGIFHLAVPLSNFLGIHSDYTCIGFVIIMPSCITILLETKHSTMAITLTGIVGAVRVCYSYITQEFDIMYFAIILIGSLYFILTTMGSIVMILAVIIAMIQKKWGYKKNI